MSGALKNVFKHSLMNGLDSTGVNPVLSDWINVLLSCRQIKAQWGLDVVIRNVRRGAPQGRMLSPLLWTLAINELIKKMEGRAAMLRAYAVSGR